MSGRAAGGASCKPGWANVGSPTRPSSRKSADVCSRRPSGWSGGRCPRSSATSSTACQGRSTWTLACPG
eukprot:9481832-Alexandrium_andersonii.AAC.1